MDGLHHQNNLDSLLYQIKMLSMKNKTYLSSKKKPPASFARGKGINVTQSRFDAIGLSRAQINQSKKYSGMQFITENREFRVSSQSPCLHIRHKGEGKTKTT